MLPPELQTHLFVMAADMREASNTEELSSVRTALASRLRAHALFCEALAEQLGRDVAAAAVKGPPGELH